MDHAVRVTREGYKPRPGVCLSQHKFNLLIPAISDDVLRARVATSGPIAHTIVAEGFSGRGKRWTIYDVGGSCTQRGMATFFSADFPGSHPLPVASWAQFFDDGM